MQRITRIAFDSNNPDTILLLEQYHSLLLLLKPYLTERTFSILATPKLIDNQQYVGWYTDLEGQPLLLDNIINQLQKGEITKKLQTRLNDIETAVNLMSLSNEEQNLVSIWLPKIKSSSNLIYVINDEPVIVNTFQEGVQPAPAPIFAPIPFWHWWHFLLLALFLVGLLGLLWYLFCPLAKPKIVPAEPVSKPVISAPVEEKQPEPVPEPATILQQSEPPLVSEPIAKSEPALTPAAVPKVKNPPNCITKEEIKKNSNPSKMVMIFDNSLSMTVTLNEPPQEVEKYFQYMSYDYGRNMSEQDRINYEKRMTRLPTRLSSSKNVATSSIDKIQQNIDISLVTLTSCPAADVSPFYNYTNRGTLKRKIKRLTPTAAGGGGTPLYSGLQKASQMLDGVKRDDYILIISDGEDNCSRNNICTLVNYIASQKPRLKINIVDIAGEHKIDCIANATGGKVYIAQSSKDMIKQMNKAVSSLKINRPTCQ
ncbi:VWA domain-containing protein [Gilliamella intestini]|uniref:von Willebrand factor type A domain-containing protein n=1 Tax=Gilliamella intestini TaxID=1798183 RepID=A0A1C3Z6R2_9GAMM|nr:VWA domain-containing protein [Gilliamella intestini]SCB77990.1 von Willebrand factor type A domain-containing protein [Gilliamella intestini]